MIIKRSYQIAKQVGYKLLSCIFKKYYSAGDVGINCHIRRIFYNPVFVVILFLTHFNSVKSQSKFNRIYDFDSLIAYQNLFHQIEAIDSNKFFFLGGNFEEVNSYHSNFFYGTMNDSGEILQMNKVYMDSVSGFYKYYSCFLNENIFSVFCTYLPSKDMYDLYLFAIKPNLDTLWTRKFELSKYQIFPQKIIVNKKNNLVVVGGYGSCFSCVGRDFYWEIDTFGNTVTIDTNTFADLHDIVVSKTDNGYICAGIAYIGSEGENQVCKLDSLGRRVWSTTFGGVGHDGSVDVENINDTTFLVCGFRRLVAFGPSYANLIIITESNRLIRDFLPSTAEVQLQVIEKIIKKGNYYYGYGYSQGADDSVVIFCMDTTFNFVWARYYLRDRSPNLLYDFRATDDGGFIACGTLLGPYNQDGWVLKLDSLGCDVSNCWIKDTTIDTATIIIPAYSSLQNIKIYPNPIRDKFQVEFEAMDLGENYSIEIKNILSEIIFTRMLDENKSEIDIHSLDAALYFYEIKNKAGMRVACGKLLKE